MNANITVTGASLVRSRLEQMRQAGGRWAAGPRVGAESRLSYAPAVETGMRGGRMWRRAGPARMFQRGLQEVAPTVPARVRQAVVKGPQAVDSEKRAIGRDLVAAIQKHTPVRTGRLRGSIRESFR